MRPNREPVKRRTRRLFVAGKIRPVREPRPCDLQWHAGPLVDTVRFDAFGGMWTGMGMCAACRSTVHASQIRRAS